MTKMTRYAAAGIAGLVMLVAACDNGLPTPQTPAQVVFATKGSYSIGLDATLAYGRLPLCKPASPPLCHDAAILKTATKSAHAADAMLDIAEEVVRNPLFGKAAITDALLSAEAATKAFRSISDQLKVK